MKATTDTRNMVRRPTIAPSRAAVSSVQAKASE
ncbi:Uncharacterised protein [Mycobacteroides abscessus subsp. abscessus]|nr:Uncharacterised protein [Mycobacteroides abscessus subsp. abscessus]